MSLMPRSKPFAHFTPLRWTAAEASVRDDEDRWNNEGGHITSSSGCVVSTPDSDLPYKAILTRLRGQHSEHPFATIREAEAFIRRNTPAPAARPTLYDRDAPAV
jgi:hypothetical protein